MTALILSVTAGYAPEDREDPDAGPSATSDSVTGDSSPGATRVAADAWPRFHGDDVNSGYSEAIVPRDNTILWEATPGKEVYSSPAIADGKVYYGAHDKFVHCVDLETGKELWNYEMGDKIYSSPTVAHGLVFIGSGTEVTHVSTKMVALDADTGDEIWVFETPGSVFSSAAIRNGIAYFGDEHGWFYAVDAAGNGDGTTTVKWKMHTGGDVWCTPAFKGKEVLFTGGECRFYVANAETGAVRLNVSTPFSYDGILASPTVAGGKVLIGSAAQPEGLLICFDLDTGAELWNISTGQSTYGISATPAVHDGVVYCGANNGIMYALELKDGNELWTYQTGDTSDGIYSSPVVADGLVLFGSSDRYFYALDVDDGSEVWKYETGPGMYGIASSPAVVDNKVIVGCGEGRLICFGEASPTTFNLGIDVIVLESFPEQTSVKVWAELPDGTPLPGVAVELETSHLTFDNSTGVTDSLGIWTTGFVADTVVEDTNVTIHASGSLADYTPQSAEVNYTIRGTPPAQLVIVLDPAAPVVAPGQTMTLGVTVTADGIQVGGVRVVYSTAPLTAVTLDPPNFITSNATSPVTLNLTFSLVQEEGGVPFDFTATLDGYLEGSLSANITIDPDAGGDGGTDGGDGGTDGGDGGTDGGDGTGDDGSSSSAGEVDVGGASLPLSVLIGVVAAVVVAVIFIILIVVAKKAGAREDDEGEEDN